jgi:hypothetical protein
MQNPNLDPNDEDFKIVMKYHFYISNDKTHDSYFVQHYLFLHWEDTVKVGLGHCNIGYGLMVVAFSLNANYCGTL